MGNILTSLCPYDNEMIGNPEKDKFYREFQSTKKEKNDLFNKIKGINKELQKINKVKAIKFLEDKKNDLQDLKDEYNPMSFYGCSDDERREIKNSQEYIKNQENIRYLEAEITKLEDKNSELLYKKSYLETDLIVMQNKLKELDKELLTYEKACKIPLADDVIIKKAQEQTECYITTDEFKFDEGQSIYAHKPRNNVAHILAKNEVTYKFLFKDKAKCPECRQDANFKEFRI